jgi:hypothetical protein
MSEQFCSLFRYNSRAFCRLRKHREIRPTCELQLEHRGDSRPLHDRRSRHAPQNSLFVLIKAGTVVAIPPPPNRLVDIDRHPFFVFGERRVRLLQIAEFTGLVRRTRHVPEQGCIFRCFRSMLFCREHLMALSVTRGSAIGLSPADAWILFVGSEEVCGDDRANWRDQWLKYSRR